MPSAVILATISGACVIAQLIVAKATRDSLFLSSFPATALPTAVLATAAITLPAVLAGSRLIARLGPQVFLLAFLSINAVAFGAEWLLVPSAPRWVAAANYLHVGLFGGLSTSGFWSVVNERFDPHTARRAFARIGFGVSLGGLLGGAMAERFATWFGVRSLLLTLVFTNLVVTAAMLGIGRAQCAVAAGQDKTSGLKVLARSGYLQALASLVVVVAISASTLDYSFKSAVAAAIAQPERLAKFFAVYYMTTSLVTVIVQATAASYSLARLGLGITLAVLPATLLVGGGLAIFWGGLGAVVLLRGTEAILSASFFRSAYEPLYTPLPPQQKRATKAIVDVAADRLGDGLGNAVIMLVLAVAPTRTWPAALGTAILAAMTALWLVFRLQRGYVAELAMSLRKGMIRLLDDDVKDATTRLTLSQTHGSIDRKQVLREIAALRKHPVASPELVQAVTELASGEPERILRELARAPLDQRLVACVIPLLEYHDLRDATTLAIAPVASASVGQLGDALVDPQLPETVRHRIPAILAKVTQPNAVRALTNGLSEPDFELRERCARGLLALRRHEIGLCPPQSLILSAIQSELAVSPAIWAARGQGSIGDDPALSGLAGLRRDRSLSHVFTLLCLCLDPDEIEMALRAFEVNDPKLRGTALEYLDNVVPNEVKSSLWPHITDQRPTQTQSARSHRELAAELKRSFSG